MMHGQKNIKYTYSYRYIQQFHSLSITVMACLTPLTDWLFKTVTMPCQTTQQNFTFLGLVAAILNWGHAHYNRSYMNPIQEYIAYNLYTVTPQPGPKNTLPNCICTPCFDITTCFNIVINLSSMPGMRLKQWVANKSDTLLCHVAHISDITHAN